MIYGMALKEKKAKQENIRLEFDTEPNCLTIFHIACSKPPLFDLFVKYARDTMRFDIYDGYGWTPMHIAVRNPEIFERIKKF